MEVFKVSLDRIQQRFFGADRVDIPGGSLQGSRPGQGSAASSSLVFVLQMTLDKGFFALFQRGKVRGQVRTRGRN